MWVVAVHIPSLTFVQPVSVVDDANLPKATVGASFDNGVANTSFVEPSGCTHMETWTRAEKYQFYATILRRW